MKITQVGRYRYEVHVPASYPPHGDTLAAVYMTVDMANAYVRYYKSQGRNAYLKKVTVPYVCS